MFRCEVLFVFKAYQKKERLGGKERGREGGEGRGRKHSFPSNILKILMRVLSPYLK